MFKTIKLFFTLIFFTLDSTKAFSVNLHEELLDKLERLYPIEINFEQINNNNDIIKGWMIIGGKGLARTEFAPPNNLVIVADGKWIIFYDALYNRTTYLPLNKGIFNTLLNPSEINKDTNIDILKEVNDKKIIYKISANKTGYSDELYIFFEKENHNRILGWEIIKDKKREIKVVINNSKQIEENILKKNSYFTLTEEMKKNDKVFKGPFKRIIKKIPNHGKPM